MNKIILDTNCYTAFLAGDPKILQALTEAKITYMSIFVLGELYAGFKGGTREKENLSILRKFLDKPSVITVNASIETAALFGMVKDILKQSGCPIPINDVWIAAHTLECGAALVTRDQHFLRIPGLRLWENN
ncbi:MAG: type II toxin-antitoxin system VapC family toxin [Proteobacteria bacterium]|nr:type II toxin-antitoxin system VapC family toxin [Pseudomonadota bacterium]